MGMNVLVTGASAGMGSAIARRFASEGHTVIAAGRRVERLDALAAEFPAGRVHPMVVDVRDRASVSAAIAHLPAGLAAIDVLINNAGLSRSLEPAYKVPLDDWDEMVDTNIKGLLYITRAVLPGMVERDRGLVVNLGSTAASYPYPGGNVYGGTKAFVQQFSRNLRADLLGTRVRVSNVEPGMVGGTEFSEVRFAGDAERAAKVYEGVEALTPQDMADIIFWIASQPAHININNIELMPVQQAAGALAVHRRKS